MLIIDAHAHYLDEPHYLKNLLKTMEINEIEKCCLSGLGEKFFCRNNSDVKRAFKMNPDKIIDSYYIQPGVSGIDEIQEAYNDGFKMLKVTIPTKPYNHKSFYPLWEMAEKLKMPILFHTGIVTIPNPSKEISYSSWDMHPMRLEPIANNFNKLNIIIAHLGVHWNNEAAELIRMRPNVYSDITGEPDGWRVRAERIGLRKWLWWEGAFKKLVFGTDVHYSKIPDNLNQDKNWLIQYNIDKTTQKLYFANNILNLLGMIENG
jgi:hypothetical protein